jgi:hypothetical protein
VRRLRFRLVARPAPRRLHGQRTRCKWHCSQHGGAPGAIETDFGGGAVRDNPDINKLFAEMTALGRAGL